MSHTADRGMGDPAESDDGPKCLLDSTMFPHLLDNIVRLAPRDALLALRQTSKGMNDLAERFLCRHLVYSPPTWRVRFTNLVVDDEDEHEDDEDYAPDADNRRSSNVDEEDDSTWDGDGADVSEVDCLETSLSHARIVDLPLDDLTSTISFPGTQLSRLRLLRQTIGHSMYSHHGLRHLAYLPGSTVVRFIDLNNPTAFVPVDSRVRRVVTNIVFDCAADPSHPPDQGEVWDIWGGDYGHVIFGCNETFVLFTPRTHPTITRTPTDRVTRPQRRSAMINKLLYELVSEVFPGPLHSPTTNNPSITLVGAETWEHNWLSPLDSYSSEYPPFLREEPLIDEDTEPGTGMADRTRWWLRRLFTILFEEKDRSEGTNVADDLVPAAMATIHFITLDEFRACIDDDVIFPYILYERPSNHEVV